MSSTNRGAERRKNDAYYTPDALAEAIVEALDGPGLIEWVLEPHVGGGAFARAVKRRWSGVRVNGLDIDPEAAGQRDCDRFEVGDFLSLPKPLDPDDPPTLIIGNPPFKDAEAHIRQALSIVAPGGSVVFLLRLAMLESKRRVALWREHPPTEVLVLPKRPSFTGGSTDSAAYAVFRWTDGAERLPIGWLEWGD